MFSVYALSGIRIRMAWVYRHDRHLWELLSPTLLWVQWIRAVWISCKTGIVGVFSHNRWFFSGLGSLFNKVLDPFFSGVTTRHMQVFSFPLDLKKQSVQCVIYCVWKIKISLGEVQYHMPLHPVVSHVTHFRIIVHFMIANVRYVPIPWAIEPIQDILLHLY